MQVSFELFDLNGKLIQQLFKERVKKGSNKFSFDAAFLSGGEYILVLKGENNFLCSSKFIKD